jgi:hypothetical protein
VDANWGSNDKETFDKADTFVLGFRLHEVKIHPKGDIDTNLFVDGAKLGMTGGDQAQWDKIELETDGMETENARAADFGFGKSSIVMDENSGEQCECVIVI